MTRGPNGHCLECGVAIAGTARREFCDNRRRCKNAFGNRQAQRGRILYMFYMAHRFERDDARRAKLQSVMNRLASVWREEDNKARAGRPSWSDWRKYLDENPWLKAEHLGHTTVGRM